MILANYGIVSSSGGVSFDTDALSFITAAAITDNTQKTAVNTLVTDLKTANIWTKMKAIYPFVGGSASSHKWNLKDPRDSDAAYRLVFNGGWTHSSTGALPNGTTGYADTYLTPSTSLSQDSTHFSYYSRTNTASTGVDFGAFAAGQPLLYGLIKYTDGNSYFRINRASGTPENQKAMTAANVFFMLNRVSGYTGEILFVNNTKTSFGSASTGLSNLKLSLGALNNSGIYLSFSNKEAAFVSIGDGLTDVEAANFYTSVQLYQTTLSRNV
jgi:hypothetical protein